jgi:cyclase
MLKKRLIPVLYLRNGLIVRSQSFHDFREFGNPVNQLERLSDWNSDELIYVDITRQGDHDLKRDDLKVKNQLDVLGILREIAKHCFMPLTFGGRIFDLERAAAFIANGADKVIVNTGAYRNPALITQIADRFGSQALVVGIDVKKEADGRHRVYVNQGQEPTELVATEWAKQVAALGAGEIFLNSIDRDGTGNGYDLDIISAVANAVTIPVIACGGAGMFEDFQEVFEKTNASAVAAGNIFNFTENAYIRAKKELVEAGCPVRPFARFG